MATYIENLEQIKNKYRVLQEFVLYVHDFYGKGSDLYDMGATTGQIWRALAIYLTITDIPFEKDTVDRERIRDIMIEIFNLKWPTE